MLWQKDMTKSNDFIRQLISRSAREIEAFNECGLIDAEYAFEIYDDFAQSYHQNKWVSTQEVPENDKKAESFQCDEEDYVEGRWSITARFGHTNLVDYANTFYHILDANVVGLIKEGIVYPDKRDSGLGNDAHGNPEWHGSWYLDENGTNYLVNYIACYELMTRIALKGGDDSSFTDYTKIWGISKKMFNRIKGKISTTKLGNKSWSTILGSRNNKANRKYFLWGCALHNLTDILAHSTKRKENGKIGAGIGHSKLNNEGLPEADNCFVVKNRWEVAIMAVAFSLGALDSGLCGDWVDIEAALDLQFDNTWVKKKLYTYAKSNAKGLDSYDTKLFKRASTAD